MNIESAAGSIKGSLKMRKMESDTEEAVRFIPTPPSSATQGEQVGDEKDFKAQRIRTVALINLAGMMERMDEQVSTQQHWKSGVPIVCSMNRPLLLWHRFCLRSTTLLARRLMQRPRSWVT